MRRCLLILIVAACLVAADSGDETTKADIAKWQGAWQATSMLSDGKSMSDEQLKKIKLMVSGTDYHFQNGSFNERGRYKFDVAKSPKQLDIIVGDGADKGKVYQVIYKVDGDRLTICLEKANSRRPTEFTGAAGSGCVLEEWQRVKPAAK
jgi:uncharacterized protein (TIGR03067 family)